MSGRRAVDVEAPIDWCRCGPKLTAHVRGGNNCRFPPLPPLTKQHRMLILAIMDGCPVEALATRMHTGNRVLEKLLRDIFRILNVNTIQEVPEAVNKKGVLI